MVAPSDQRLVLPPLIAHVHMSARKPFTLVESVMNPCMEIASREIHGGTIDYDLRTKTAIVRYQGGNRAIPPKFSKHV